MHPLYKQADALSRIAIGAAIEVHRFTGPGLIESIYEKCMMRELSLRSLHAVNQRLVKIEYKGATFEEPLRFDVLLEDCLLLELKSVQEILPIHKAQLLRILECGGKRSATPLWDTTHGQHLRDVLLQKRRRRFALPAHYKKGCRRIPDHQRPPLSASRAEQKQEIEDE